MQQNTDEWRMARVGCVTASRMGDLTARTRNGWGAGRDNYMAELIAERLTGVPAESYTNAAMQHGTDTEPEARIAYQFYADVEVTEVGLCMHPSIAMTAASPDGIIAPDGLVEIKAPNTATHLRTLLGEPIDGKYIKQVMWQMACTGAHWCDWISYDPRLPESMKLFVQRVPRDEDMITDLEKQVREFLAELDAKVAALRERYEQRQAA